MRMGMSRDPKPKVSRCSNHQLAQSSYQKGVFA